MNKEILREIGLTEGEIRVYESLVTLGKSSTGPIMDKSGISSSKVYIIIEKLIEKGLVSFIVENNVKKFSITDPKNIVEYVKKKKEKIEELEKESQKFSLELISQIGTHEEESAQIYKGMKGLRSAFNNIVESLDNRGEYLYFSVSEKELDKRTSLFFKNLNLKRREKKITTKGIIDIKCKDKYLKTFKNMKNFKMKFSKLTIPSALTIGKDRILLTLWEENPIAFEIVSKRIAERYTEFFKKMWDSINF